MAGQPRQPFAGYGVQCDGRVVGVRQALPAASASKRAKEGQGDEFGVQTKEPPARDRLSDWWAGIATGLHCGEGTRQASRARHTPGQGSGRGHDDVAVE